MAKFLWYNSCSYMREFMFWSILGCNLEIALNQCKFLVPTWEGYKHDVKHICVSSIQPPWQHREGPSFWPRLVNTQVWGGRGKAGRGRGGHSGAGRECWRALKEQEGGWNLADMTDTNLIPWIAWSSLWLLVSLWLCATSREFSCPTVAWQQHQPSTGYDYRHFFSSVSQDCTTCL